MVNQKHVELFPTWTTGACYESRFHPGIGGRFNISRPAPPNSGLTTALAASASYAPDT
jgi:hypothetical protein